MRTGYFLFLAFLLGNVFGCQGVAQNKNQTNQQSNQNVAPIKRESLKLKLNNDEIGTTDDTSALTKRLAEVFSDRADYGTLREGTNEVEKTVNLAADRSASAEEIAKIFGAINESRASPILIPVEVKNKVKNTVVRPNPLFLIVYAGSGESSGVGWEIDWGFIEIGFIGELSDKNGGFPPVKGAIGIVVEENGTYTLDGSQISASDLKAEIENRLKAKEKEKKIVFVQAENFGNIQAAASIAHSAGADKVIVSTGNIEHKENDTTFSLSPSYFKQEDKVEIPEYPSFRYGPLEITYSEELVDDEEIKQEYERRKEEWSEEEVSLTEIGGSSGVLTILTHDGRYNARWIGSRKKDGQQKLVSISFGTDLSDYSHAEFLRIIKSIRFD